MTLERKKTFCAAEDKMEPHNQRKCPDCEFQNNDELKNIRAYKSLAFET
jgi:hypothetical protein